ncbi:MAG: PAS domain S-box protein, partial [Candidatus Omnitrophota bacterium]|nr:PAS domain S-box protein [Candidatus Omnitrophota bacterium]
LAIRATVESADEIGQLASAFNRMVEDLGKITVSKAEMDNIINTMINTLIVATPEGKIRVVNRATLDLLGYREEELLGQSIGMIFEEEEEILLKGAGIAEILARRVVSNIEKTYRTKGGRLIPVLFSAAVMNAAPGAPADIVCVAQDISDRKALEEGLRNSYEDLKNLQTQLVQSGKLASIGELASGVAHELNQPLMVIRGTAQLIERAARKGSIPSEALLTQLEPIDRNTKRMMRIINHLRNFSRQSGTEFQPLEINHVIEECFLLIGEQLKLRDIVVERELAPDLPKIRGEANQLEQVFLNLIANSRDAVTEAREKAAAAGREAPPGGITIISRLVQYHPHPSL